MPRRRRRRRRRKKKKKSKRMKWAGHVACMGDVRSACKILAGKRKGKRPL
jgi:hypothetical protein